MNDSRQLRLETLFHACLELPAGQRAAWLAGQCGDDAALRAEIEDLLARDSRTGAPSLGPVLRFGAEPLPATIGPYRLGERLGEGGFGEVYAAEQESPVRRPVALKVLKAGMDSRAVLARFEAERQTLALMDHPGIARIFDAGATPGGRPYFVMERVDGEAITTFCDRHRLATRARLELMIAVCRGVEHAHQKGVIHRDLKPSNILVTLTDGKPFPKIIDFGIAKATGGGAGEDAFHTRQGEFLGTPEYASPEQTEPGGANVDTRTDVYALGAVLYRLLTGQPTFESERLRSAGLVGMARILREEDPPRPSDRVGAAKNAATRGAPAVDLVASARELRGDLDWISLKALDKDRARRYPSATAFAEDLERHLHDEPVVAGPPGAGYRLQKFARRRRGLVVGGAAVALTLVAGIIATVGQSVRARDAEEDARHQAEVATAVSAFLTRMLGAADPERNPRGADVTVREILDGAARELDATRSGSAEIESGMRQALGATYMGLALYEDAEKQLRRAAELRERAAGAGAGIAAGSPTGRGGNPDAIETRLSLAELNVRRGAYPVADSLLASLDSRVNALGKAHSALRVRYLRLRGDNFTNLGRNEAADSLLTTAVAMARGVGAAASLAPTPDSLTLAGALNDLARLRSRLGQTAAAESLSREALEISRRVRGGDDHDVANVMSRLAEILRQAGGYSEAESLFREAVEIERRVLGPRHPGLAYTLSNWAVALEEMGRSEEAERCHREALDLLRGALGDEHPEVVVSMGNLATALQDRGKFDEALALRRRVLETTRRIRGPGHYDVPSSLNNLGSLYRLMHRYPEAEAAFREAIAGFRSIFGEAHPLVAVATGNLGKTLMDHGRAAEAEATLSRALELAGRVFPPEHVNLAIFSASHARALTALGRYAEAEHELVPARERIVATFGPAHTRAKETALDLAKLYAGWGRVAEAARWRATVADTTASAAARP